MAYIEYKIKENAIKWNPQVDSQNLIEKLECLVDIPKFWVFLKERKIQLIKLQQADEKVKLYIL